MKASENGRPTSYSGQKATLDSAPKTAGRHKNPKFKPASGHACKGAKIKK